MLTNPPVPFDGRLVGAFSVIVQPVVEPMDRFTALVAASRLPGTGLVSKQSAQTQQTQS